MTKHYFPKVQPVDSREQVASSPSQKKLAQKLENRNFSTGKILIANLLRLEIEIKSEVASILGLSACDEIN